MNVLGPALLIVVVVILCIHGFLGSNGLGMMLQGDAIEFERQLALMKADGISPTELTWVQMIRKARMVSAHEVEQIWSKYTSQVDQAGYPCLAALVHSLSW